MRDVGPDNAGCSSSYTWAVLLAEGVGIHQLVTASLLPAGRGSPVRALEGLQGEPYLPKPEVLRLAGIVEGSFGGEVLRPDEASRCSAGLDLGEVLWIWCDLSRRRVQAGTVVW